jgi:hypothetical protein
MNILKKIMIKSIEVKPFLENKKNQIGKVMLD